MQADTRHANDGGTLVELDDEARSVAELLRRGGLDVYLLTSGRYSELTELLTDSDICERLLVFHFCGHAAGEYVRMSDDNGKPVNVSAEGLADQMKSESNALRLVYMNACLTNDQEDEYRAAFPRVNFIGTKIEVPDWYAKKFALDFYQRFVGSEAPYGNVQLKHALARAAGEDKGLKPKRVGTVWQMNLGEDASPDSTVATLPDFNFKLDEGMGLISAYILQQRQRRAPSVVLIYAAFVIVVQFLLMYLASGWNQTSSPAFQAAFGFQPDCATIADIRARLEDQAGIRSFIIGERKDCVALPGTFELGTRTPMFAVFVEWGRTVVLSLVLIVLCTMIYRRLPRDYPRLFSRETGAWLRLRNNRKFIVLFFAGLITVSAYHAIIAHATLSEVEVSSTAFSGISWLQARWPIYFDDPSIWARFEDTMLPRLPVVDGEPDFAVFADLPRSDPLYWAMFVRPYTFYLGYSLMNYLGTALPVLAVIVNGLTFGAVHMRQRLTGLRVQVRLTRDGYETARSVIERRLATIRDEMAGHFARFVTTFVLLCLFAAYEVFIGKTTTAFFAQIAMLLIFLLVLVGVSNIAMVWNSYRDELLRISEFIDGIDETVYPGANERLESFDQQLRKAYMPMGRGAAIALGLGFIAMLYMAYILLFEGLHWTSFTHDLPLFG
ncbi:MAG: hypothetical protein AAGA70_02880 [Pseudomonadota bacterium]